MERERPWNVSEDGKRYIESLQVVGFRRANGEYIRVSWPITHFTKDGKYAFTEDGICYETGKQERKITTNDGWGGED